MTPEEIKELDGLLSHVRDGWVPEPHEHPEKGCICLSCYVTTGWEMGNDYYTTYCDEQESGDPECLQQLMTYEEARTVQLLLKYVNEITVLLKEHYNI